MGGRDIVITIDDLKRCAALSREVRNIVERMEAYRSLIERSTPSYSPVPAPSGNNDKLADGIAALLELQEQATARIKAYLQHIAVVETKIDTLPDPTHRTILRMRYIDGMTWDEISDILNYSERHCYRLHDESMIILFNKKTCQRMSVVKSV